MNKKLTAKLYQVSGRGDTVRVGAVVPDYITNLSSEFYIEIECLDDRAPAARKMLKRLLKAADYVVIGD